MSPHAVYHGSQSLSLAGTVVGTEQPYTSQLLAAALPTANDFTDRNGTLTQTGRFFVSLDQRFVIQPGMYG